MKLKPYMIIGILFIVVFLGATIIGHAIGFWNLPGQNPESEHNEEAGVEHVEGENHEETASSSSETELHGYMNLKDYLTQNGVNLECVAAKIGVTKEELNTEAKELAHSKGFEMEQIQEFAKECKEQEQTPTSKNNVTNPAKQDSDKETAAIGNNGKTGFEGKDITQIINGMEKMDKSTSDQIKKMLEEARKNGEVPVPGDIGALPFLSGTDNLKKYCTDNGISMDCLSQKLGIPVSDFDKTAKEIAAKLSTGHVEQIRDLLPTCIDYSR